MLATPTSDFVHEVSSGLATPARRLVHVIFHSAHHCVLTTWRYLTPAAPDGFLDTGNPDSTSTTAPLARLHRLRLHHPTLSATSTSAQRATALLENLVSFCSSHNFRDASTVTTVVGMSVGSTFGFFSSLTVCIATAVTKSGRYYRPCASLRADLGFDPCISSPFA